MAIKSGHHRLYVIGNGFDLHHGLPCGYADFNVVRVERIMGTTHERYCGRSWLVMLMSLNRHPSDDDVER